MDRLLSWEVIGWLIGIVVPLGFGFTAMDDFKLAKACFFIAMSAFAAKGLWWAMTDSASIAWRSGVAFLWVGIAAALSIVAIEYVNGKIGIRGAGKEEIASPHSAAAQPSEQPLPPMPSILSLFMTDFQGKGSGGGVSLYVDAYADLTFQDHTKLRLLYKVIQDYGSRSKFAIFYVPSSPHTYDAIEFLSSGHKQYIDLPFGADTGSAHSPSITKTSELVFTGRLFIYHEDTLTLSQLGKLAETYEKEKVNPEFRTTSYALAVWDSIRSGIITPPPRYEIKDGLPQKVGG